MDLTNKRTIQNILKKYGLRPNKRLGQHFLISWDALNKIIEAAELKSDDVVLEIGPGIGTLTRELARRTKKVIAVEKDPQMCAIINEVLQDFDTSTRLSASNIEIIQGDILKIRNLKLKIKNFKVVANLPYYITAPVIRMFLEAKKPPQMMALMVQKEVAQRICAKPPKMSLLGVSVQFYAEPEILGYVPKTAFWPPPKVDSAIIKIIPRESALLSASIREQFFRIVKAGFSHPRKQIIGNFAKELGIEREKVKEWLGKSGIKPEQRAESLNIEDWTKLTNNYPQR